MTWSIIAKDAPTGRIGIIVATRFFAVGAMVPHIRTGVGAVASQAFINPLYGPQGLALLEAGLGAEETVGRLTAADAGRDNRQLHAMDREGNFAAYTGAACIDWCGHALRENFSVAGNMLAGPAVLADSIRAYESQSALPFARRLIAAMRAGEAAGGDKRGKQSAALLVYTTEEYPALSIRADDHSEPIAELRRLYQKAHERYIPFMRCAPTQAQPSGTFDRQEIEKTIAEYEESRTRAP